MYTCVCIICLYVYIYVYIYIYIRKFAMEISTTKNHLDLPQRRLKGRGSLAWLAWHRGDQPWAVYG